MLPLLDTIRQQKKTKRPLTPGQPIQYQRMPFEATTTTNTIIQPGPQKTTRDHQHPTTTTTHHDHRHHHHHAHAVQPVQSSLPRLRPLPPPHSPSQPAYPKPGPPDRYMNENGREIPIWYNPPGIVDKEMTSVAQAEYDRVRRQIINGRR